jgi:hypothetical protein
MADNDDRTKEVVALLKKGKTLGETAKELGVTVNQIAPTYYKAEPLADPSLKIDDDAASIVAARDEDGLRWERIAARSGLTVGKVKALHEEGGGDASKRTGRVSTASKENGDDSDDDKGKATAKAGSGRKSRAKSGDPS